MLSARNKKKLFHMVLKVSKSNSCVVRYFLFELIYSSWKHKSPAPYFFNSQWGFYWSRYRIDNIRLMHPLALIYFFLLIQALSKIVELERSIYEKSDNRKRVTDTFMHFFPTAFSLKPYFWQRNYEMDEQIYYIIIEKMFNICQTLLQQFFWM